MAISKAKTYIIADKCAVTMRETGVGGFLEVGYTKGESQIIATPVMIDLENGQHQTGVEIEGKFILVQFTEAVKDEIKAYVGKDVDIKFTGGVATIECTAFNFAMGVEAKFDMKSVLGFPCSFHRFAKLISTGISITPA